MTNPLLTTGTILTLTATGSLLPFYSALDLEQTLEPIEEIQNSKDFIQRSCGGTLVNMVPTQFLKYKSKISASANVSPPAFNAVWPGTIVTVGCCQVLIYPVGGTADRSGSTPVLSEDGSTYSFYPTLTMMVTGWSQGFREWKGEYPWDFELEEV